MGVGIFHIGGSEIFKVSSIVQGLSIGLPVELQKNPAERRLSATAFTDQAEGFPPKDIDIDSVDRLDDKPPLFQREMLLQPAYFKQDILIFHFVPPSPDRSSEQYAAFLR